ncbi:unnamed protein product [Owenia fusiformis]|uniref:5'-nucleotidase n=1 Tax=Owenia fusiformis TaxID=6347 RepID=A0A8J1TTE1_OWEFU|nr:unnamed protein product [Owenia fusiformis]
MSYLCIRIFLVCSITGIFKVYEALNITLLHTNDVHARIEEFNSFGGTCSPTERDNKECYGGVARRLTKIKEIRQIEQNVLLLDAGDQFQGTVWFYAFDGLANAQFMNMMAYDAMSLGNHEFDIDINGLVAFLDNTTFPVLACNVDDSEEPRMQGKFKKSTVVEFQGEKIGIIGYLISTMPELSLKFGKLKFQEEIPSIQAEVRRMEGEGINKIIAVGHSGWQKDLEIAKEVTGLDLVVGGHSNTFLYNGPVPGTPENELVEGPYPTVVTQTSGAKVLAVQDFHYAKYLGHLQLSFDDNGVVTSWDGNPIYLNGSIDEDADMVKKMAPFVDKLAVFKNTTVGSTNVFLDGERSSCRYGECNFGNFYADALLDKNIYSPTDTAWNNVSLAVMNSGGIRSSIKHGDITMESILNALPFQNLADIVEMTGQTVWDMFENSISRISTGKGRFLQVSGFEVEYNIGKPVGSRVVSIKAACANCMVPKLEELDLSKHYKIVMPDYIANGGDGYSVIRDNKINHFAVGDIDSKVLERYIRKMSPITAGVQSRITMTNSTTSLPCTSSSLQTWGHSIGDYFIIVFAIIGIITNHQNAI